MKKSKLSPVFFTPYSIKITAFEKLLGFILLLVFISGNKTNSDISIANDKSIRTELNEVKSQNNEFIKINKNLHSQNTILMNYLSELSGTPNEKRKAIFEIKIQQDSVLIELLSNDIRTNNIILKLLDNEWMFNDSTKFTTLKTK